MPRKRKPIPTEIQIVAHVGTPAFEPRATTMIIRIQNTNFPSTK